MLLLGIDGGGSGVRARLTDLNGALLGEGRSGAAKARSDPEAARRHLLEAAGLALRAGGLELEAGLELAVGIGLAGVDRPSDRQRLLELGLPFPRYLLATDAAVARLGAHGGEIGGVLICGTGSIAYAESAGRSRRSGGWGFPLGDEGGGAWLGWQALRHYLAGWDKRSRRDQLYQAVAERFREPAELLEWARGAGPGDYASFAPLVSQTAGSGCRAAQAILAAAGRELSKLIRAADPSGALAWCAVGGLAATLTPWLDPRVRARLQPPKEDALAGALLLARRCLKEDRL